jgi:hypothetical protein
VVWEDCQPRGGGEGAVLKRSKQREGSADEDSSARAERFKANRNLDGSGMLQSKSFLVFFILR